MSLRRRRREKTQHLSNSSSPAGALNDSRLGLDTLLGSSTKRAGRTGSGTKPLPASAMPLWAKSEKVTSCLMSCGYKNLRNSTSLPFSLHLACRHLTVTNLFFRPKPDLQPGSEKHHPKQPPKASGLPGVPASEAMCDPLLETSKVLRSSRQGF